METLTDREQMLVKQAARMAMRMMAESIAQQALAMSKEGLVKTASGPTALQAFANAIMSNNAHVWGDEGAGS